MVRKIKELLFKSLSLDNYLRLLQRSYFFLYKTGILKFNKAYTYHYYIKRFIKKGDVIIDIGANLGYYSILFAQWVGTSGKVHSIEPVPEYNRIFSEKAKKYNNIELHPYALGPEEKDIIMIPYGKEHYLQTGRIKIYDADEDGNIEDYKIHFNSKMIRPAELFNSLEKLNYIKCDVEGFEVHALSYMKEIIQKHLPRVQVEISGGNKEKLNAVFAEMGYILCKIENGWVVPEENITDGDGGEFIFIHKTDKSEYIKK